MVQQDIRLDASDDLKFQDGDFELEASDAASIDRLLKASPGHWRQYPMAGISIIQAHLQSFSSAQLAELVKQIKIQLEADGFTVQRCRMTKDFQLDLKAERK